MSPSKLAIITQMEIRLNALRNTFPIGIRKIDDETDEKIKRLTAQLEEMNETYEIHPTRCTR